MGETGLLMATLDNGSRPFAPMSEGLVTFRRGGPVWPRVLSSCPSRLPWQTRVTRSPGLTHQADRSS